MRTKSTQALLLLFSFIVFVGCSPSGKLPISQPDQDTNKIETMTPESDKADSDNGERVALPPKPKSVHYRFYEMTDYSSGVLVTEEGKTAYIYGSGSSRLEARMAYDGSYYYYMEAVQLDNGIERNLYAGTFDSEPAFLGVTTSSSGIEYVPATNTLYYLTGPSFYQASKLYGYDGSEPWLIAEGLSIDFAVSSNGEFFLVESKGMGADPSELSVVDSGGQLVHGPLLLDGPTKYTGSMAISNDGNTIYYYEPDPDDSHTHILTIRELDTGAIYQLPSGEWWLRVMTRNYFGDQAMLCYSDIDTGNVYGMVSYRHGQAPVERMTDGPVSMVSDYSRVNDAVNLPPFIFMQSSESTVLSRYFIEDTVHEVLSIDAVIDRGHIKMSPDDRYVTYQRLDEATGSMSLYGSAIDREGSGEPEKIVDFGTEQFASGLTITSTDSAYYIISGALYFYRFGGEPILVAEGVENFSTSEDGKHCSFITGTSGQGSRGELYLYDNDTGETQLICGEAYQNTAYVYDDGTLFYKEYRGGDDCDVYYYDGTSSSLLLEGVSLQWH